MAINYFRDAILTVQFFFPGRVRITKRDVSFAVKSRAVRAS